MLFPTVGPNLKLLPTTLTYKLNRDKVKKNDRVKYLRQKSFYFKFIVRTHRQTQNTHTHTATALHDR